MQKASRYLMYLRQLDNSSGRNRLQRTTFAAISAGLSELVNRPGSIASVRDRKLGQVWRAIPIIHVLIRVG